MENAFFRGGGGGRNQGTLRKPTQTQGEYADLTQLRDKPEALIYKAGILTTAASS